MENQLTDKFQHQIDELKIFEESYKKQIRSLISLNNLIKITNEASESRPFLDKMLEKIKEMMQFDGCAIYLINPDSGVIKSEYTIKLNAKLNTFIKSINLNDPGLSDLLIKGIPVLLNDDEKFRSLLNKFKIKSAAGIPICSNEKVLGMLFVTSHTFTSIMPEDIEILLTVGKEIGICLERILIKEQKHIEEVMRESEEVHRILLDESPDPIFSFTPEGRYIYVNNAFAKGVLKTVDEIIGKKIWDVFDKEEADKRFAALSYTFQTGNEKVFEVRVPRPDGDHFYITTITPIKDQQNKVVTAICSSKDITDRKRMEVELSGSNEKYKQLLAELKELNSSKDKFISILSHDLRGPYQGFLGILEFLITDFENLPAEEVKYNLSTLCSALKSQYHLLEDLLQWSKLQIGRIDFVPSVLSLNDEISEVIKPLNTALIKKQIKINNLIKPDCYINADNYLFRILLRNLLSNAVKFSFPGGIITLNAVEEKSSIQISVADTGIGIREENIPKLFQMDSYFSSFGTEGEKGSGLGLLLCKEIVEKHGGNIRVESTINKGSTFYFALPKAE